MFHNPNALHAVPEELIPSEECELKNSSGLPARFPRARTIMHKPGGHALSLEWNPSYIRVIAECREVLLLAYFCRSRPTPWAGQIPCQQLVKSNANGWVSAMQADGQVECNSPEIFSRKFF